MQVCPLDDHPLWATFFSPFGFIYILCAVLVSAVASIIISGLRLLTLFNPRHWTSLVLISAVQLVNGMIGPLVMVRIDLALKRLARLWDIAECTAFGVGDLVCRQYVLCMGGCVVTRCR